jgi:hypothetical protein
MSGSLGEEIAITAARYVVEEGAEYAAAKKRAARELARRGGARLPELPSNEAVEDAVREHIAIFCADTQPAELAALRAVAQGWMRRLAAFQPHLGGAVWRGTATRLSAVHLDLYCDDPKAVEIELINGRVSYDASGDGAEDLVLTLASPSRELGEPVTLHLHVRDTDALRGALKPDAQGRSWRGDLAALERMLDAASRRLDGESQPLRGGST